MKRLGWILLLLAVSAPAWAAAKITVEQLRDKLIALQQGYKSDEEVAARLKEVELSEQLTRHAKSSLMQYTRGEQTSEQLDILEGRSAFLAPPASEIPAIPAPDPAAQKAILAKAADYAASTFLQNPHLVASRTFSRFQDNVTNMSNAPVLKVDSPNTYARLWEARTEAVESEKGTEKAGPSAAKTKWGENGLISDGALGPNPATVLQEATSAGKLSWLRWETIDGRPVAVFSFAVDKKKTHYEVSYCCFPQTDTATGVAASGTFVPVPGEIQSVTTWKYFKKTVGYHGELFIEPEKGALVRIHTSAELKPTDYVHTEEKRIDYEIVVVNGKEYAAPVASYLINEVVPGGDAGTAAYSVRHTLYSVTYQNYQMAGGSMK